MTQTELGDAVGVTRQAIAALEQAKGRLSTLLAVEKLLHLHVTGLAHGSSLADRVRATRLRADLSLRALASKSGLSVNTIRQVESGRGTLLSFLRHIEVLAPRADFRAGATRSQKNGMVTVGRRHIQKDNPSDYFATPAPITRLLLQSETFPKQGPIFEPAVGKARAIDRVLREHGYATVCIDLHGKGEERRDFLKVTDHYPSIVTNPPFSLHLEFIQQAKRVADDKIAMLLPINYLTGARRHAEIWEDLTFPLARVHVLSRGVSFTTSDPHGEKFRPSQLYVAWFVFEREHKGSPTISSVNCDQWIERQMPHAKCASRRAPIKTLSG